MHAAAWQLVDAQHGVVARRQLLELGFSARAVEHRLASGRLSSLWPGVYAVGRRRVDQRGWWIAAVLRTGPRAVLSHQCAAALWGMLSARSGPVHVSVPRCTVRRQPGIVAHRRACLDEEDVTCREGIPVTTPVCTLVDVAGCLGRRHLEVAVNEADKHGLVDPDSLRLALDKLASRPGIRPLRDLLDRATFALTDSELERRFLPLARAAGLPLPHKRRRATGFRVDFHWPELQLVVETDGLRYHRTPAQQAVDRRRDQAHAAAGLIALRFTDAQVRYESEYVVATLKAVARHAPATMPR
jgi:very-short-patch-repair endonuclease